jgi:hypothetical protein
MQLLPSRASRRGAADGRAPASASSAVTRPRPAIGPCPTDRLVRRRSCAPARAALRAPQPRARSPSAGGLARPSGALSRPCARLHRCAVPRQAEPPQLREWFLPMQPADCFSEKWRGVEHGEALLHRLRLRQAARCRPSCGRAATARFRCWPLPTRSMRSRAIIETELSVRSGLTVSSNTESAPALDQHATGFRSAADSRARGARPSGRTAVDRLLCVSSESPGSSSRTRIGCRPLARMATPFQLRCPRQTAP